MSPIEFGADIVTHSTSKYLDGHALQCGGVIIDSGKFDWKNGKFPEFTEPDESYHGIVYTEVFGSMVFIIKARMQLMRDLAPTLQHIQLFIESWFRNTCSSYETILHQCDRSC